MNWASELVDIILSDFSKVNNINDKKEDSLNIKKPEPVEGLGSLINKAISTDMNINLGDEEMNLAYSIANFFGK